MKRIQLKLRGGLGNQLFQFCAGFYLANQTKGTLIIDDRLIRRHINPERRNWISFLEEEFYSLHNLRKVGKFHSRLSAFSHDNFITNQRVLTEPSEILQEALAGDSMVTIWGYFQTVLFPQLIGAGEILKKQRERISTNGEMYSEANNAKVAGIHIRLGDFILHGWNLPFDWYFYRIEELLELGIEKFYVFSDSIVEVENQLQKKFGKNVKFCFPEKSQTLSPLELLFLMSRYHTFISSNSTLSWWSSYIDISSKHLIISPWDHENVIPNWKYVSN